MDRQLRRQHQARTGAGAAAAGAVAAVAGPRAGVGTDADVEVVPGARQRLEAAKQQAWQAKQEAETQPLRPLAEQFRLPPGAGGGGVGFLSMHETFSNEGWPCAPPGQAARGGRRGYGEEGKGQRAEGAIVNMDDDDDQEDGKMPAPATGAATAAAAAAVAGPPLAPIFKQQGKRAPPPTNERCVGGDPKKRGRPDPQAAGAFSVFDVNALSEDQQLELAVQMSLNAPQPAGGAPPPPPKPDGPEPPPSMSSASAAAASASTSSRVTRRSGASPATGGGGGPGGLAGLGWGARRIPIEGVEDETEGREAKRPREADGGGKGKEQLAVRRRPPQPPRVAATGKSRPPEVIMLSDDEAEAEAEADAGSESQQQPPTPSSSQQQEQQQQQPPTPRFHFRKEGATEEGQEGAGWGKGKAQGGEEEAEEAGTWVSAAAQQPEQRRTRSSRGEGLALKTDYPPSIAMVDLCGTSPRAGAAASASANDDDEVAIVEPGGGRGAGGWGPSRAAAAGKGKERREPTEEEEAALISFESCLTFMLDEAAKLSDPLMQGGAAAAAAVAEQGKGQGQKGPNFYQFTSEEALRDVALRLVKDELLSDEILNRALDLLAHLPQAADCVLFNTFWYEKLKDGLQDEARAWLKRALRHRDPLKLRLVLAPINIANAHWVLVFVDLDRATVQVGTRAWGHAPSDSFLSYVRWIDA